MWRLSRRVQDRRGAPRLILVWLGSALAQDPLAGDVLAGLAGCRECHTRDDGLPFAGGSPLDTAFGRFVGTNLTPDPVHGIGAWTEEDFVRAMRRGRSPDGRALWPVFPYPSFTALTDADLHELWRFLGAVTPDPTPSAPQEPTPSGLWAWRLVAFRDRGPRELERGEYLVEVVGHCDGCHSRRTGIGTERRREHLAGSDQPPHPGPNLTPHADGLAGWTDSELLLFLEVGMEPDGDFAGGGMRHVIRDGTSKLTEEDRAAMVRYLRSLPARPTPADQPGPISD